MVDIASKHHDAWSTILSSSTFVFYLCCVEMAKPPIAADARVCVPIVVSVLWYGNHIDTGMVGRETEIKIVCGSASATRSPDRKQLLQFCVWILFSKCLFTNFVQFHLAISAEAPPSHQFPKTFMKIWSASIIRFPERVTDLTTLPHNAAGSFRLQDIAGCIYLRGLTVGCIIAFSPGLFLFLSLFHCSVTPSLCADTLDCVCAHGFTHIHFSASATINVFGWRIVSKYSDRAESCFVVTQNFEARSLFSEDILCDSVARLLTNGRLVSVNQIQPKLFDLLFSCPPFRAS